MASINQMIIEMLVKDKASKGLSSVSGKVSEIDSKSKKLKNTNFDLEASYLAIAGAVYGLARTFGSFLSSAQKQEDAERRLEILMTTITKATSDQIEEIKKLSAEYQKVSVIGDDVNIMGASQLATFQVTTEQLKKLIPALDDLAVGTYGTSVSQEQMIQSANMLGKVLTGQVGALTRVGISLSDYQKELIATGDLNTKVNTIVEVIRQNYGGLATEMSTTYSGQVVKFKNELGDLGEKFGFLLQETLLPLLPKLTSFIQALTPETTLLTIKLLALIPVVQGVSKAIQALTSANPMLLAVAGGISTIMVSMEAYNRQFIKHRNVMADYVKTSVDTVIALRKIEEHYGLARGELSQFGKEFTKLEKAQKEYNKWFATEGDIFKKALGGWLTLLTKIEEKIESIFKINIPFLADAKKRMEANIQLHKKEIELLDEKVKKYTGMGMNEAIANINSLTKKAKEEEAEKLAILQAQIEKRKKLTELQILSAELDLEDEQNMLDNLRSELLENPIEINIETSGVDDLLQAIPQLKLEMGNLMTVSEGTLSIMTDLFGGRIDFKQAGQQFLNLFDSILKMFESQILASILMNKVLTIVPIPASFPAMIGMLTIVEALRAGLKTIKFAEGGVVNTPTLALLGEAGQREFVTPEITFEKKFDELAKKLNVGRQNITIEFSDSVKPIIEQFKPVVKETNKVNNLEKELTY